MWAGEQFEMCELDGSQITACRRNVCSSEMCVTAQERNCDEVEVDANTDINTNTNTDENTDTNTNTDE